MITNELVGEVLGLQENCIYQAEIFKTNLRYAGYEVEYDGTLITDDFFIANINLYEFINLAKLWAQEKGFGILSSLEECYLIEVEGIGLVAEWRHQPYMEIQAAQWLLDNRKELL